MRLTQFVLGPIVALGMLAGCSGDSTSPPTTVSPEATITGQFLVLAVPDSLNGQPTTGAFRDLTGKQITVVIAFDDIRELIRRDDVYRRGIDFATGPASVVFQGDSGLSEDLAPLFEGQNFTFQMWDEALLIDFTGAIRGVTGSESYGLGISVFLPVSLDDTGYPVLADFSNAVGEIFLSRFNDLDASMTDQASGRAAVSLTGTANAVGR